MAIIKLSATERRRVSAFFTCLVLAIFAWVFTVLSNPYNYTIKGILNFKNTPQKRAFHPLQSDTINVTVSGSGWEVLFSKMNTISRVISVDLHALENKSYIVLSSQLNKINDKKEISQVITGFYPDTLYFDFTNRKEKRVPVQLITAIKYQSQFTQSDNISISPAYIILNGPAEVIDKITQWRSDTLRLNNVNETVNTNLSLQSVKEGNLSIYPKNVQVNIPVDEFTEKALLIPVRLINNRSYSDVKIFPSKVKITFTTSFNRYAETDEDLFEATTDLELWRLHNYKTLPVVVSKIPKYCKIVKIEPSNIDFIIKK